VERVLAALDVIALPSLAEGFPNALAEALACGVPAAALAVGDGRSIVGPGGIVVPVQGDVGDGLARGEATAQGLADAFVQLARAGASERQRLGQAGRAHVLERYGLTTALSRWSAHFEQLARH
jgi:glycosyltransferase involved in cell wall biosynthesis